MRAALVEARSSLVNTARGLAKSVGERLPKCDADQLGVERREGLPVQLQQILRPLLEQIESVTIDDRDRFQKSRDVGCYVGLRPKRSESGESQPQLRITKEGDVYLRKMLVQGAHYILGYRGPDTDLKRWGLGLASHGGKNAKKRAIVAVARKLGILLHRLWVTGEVYDPLRNGQAHARTVAA